MKFYPNERIALFIDGSNLYAAARALNFDIDYKRLLDHFSENSMLVRAFYYTALIEDQEYSPIRPLVDWLDYNGYTMVTKPTKEFTDAFGRKKIKGNMDIELAIDVMEMAEHLDHAIIFSGDGDFRRLVEAIQRKGLRVTVVSTVKSNPPMIADELRRQCDRFIELMDIAPSISRDSSARPTRRHDDFRDTPPVMGGTRRLEPAAGSIGADDDFEDDLDDDDYDDEDDGDYGDEEDDDAP
ncbi:MAG: hypothetical protein Dbin4_01520 [Alphaproteobacteria bacterium]|nr:hypothetical protein [Alphaproteobacteria bacterium]